MHFGLVAVEADVAALADAFPRAWPSYAPKAEATLQGLASLWDWMRVQRSPVSARACSPDRPGTDAFGFWQDGAWAVLFDPNCVQAADDTALRALSDRFGVALAFLIETTGGCAFFSAFERGRRTRHLAQNAGERREDGERLPQEDGLPRTHFHLGEFERLMRAFGVRMPYELPGDAPVQGRAYLDRTDDTALFHATPALRPARGWWRFRQRFR